MVTEYKLKKIAEKRKRDTQRREFLLTFFNHSGIDKYEEKEINGYWLVKEFNGDTKRWQVAIFTKESFEKYKKLI